MPKVVIPGSGTSTGVPEVGCQCEVCSSSDPQDKRLRTSVLYITDRGERILFDCSPDFRYQAIRYGIDRLDAVVLTHEHYDHIGGLEDLRTLAWKQELPVYAERRVINALHQRLGYMFGDAPYPGSARLRLHEIHADTAFEVCGVEILPIRIMHGNLPILGYRIDDFAFVTDLKSVDPKPLKSLQGLSCFVLNALRWQKPHNTHQTITDAIYLCDYLDKPKTFLIHLSHQAPLMAEMPALLPPYMEAAYDGLVIDLPSAPYRYIDCGRIDYADAYTLQHSLFETAVAAKEAHKQVFNRLLFCEHNPVFTLGRHGKQANLLASEEALRSHGIDFFCIDRGGDITYHGPGQITGYPLFDLDRFGLGIKHFVYEIEEIIIDFLAQYNIPAHRMAGASGVWIGGNNPEKAARKICAIGLRTSRYCTMHGFALNVNTDTTPFSLINPCGFTDRGVTSMQAELGKTVNFEEAKHRLELVFRQHFSALLHR